MSFSAETQTTCVSFHCLCVCACVLRIPYSPHCIVRVHVCQSDTALSCFISRTNGTILARLLHKSMRLFRPNCCSQIAYYCSRAAETTVNNETMMKSESQHKFVAVLPRNVSREVKRLLQIHVGLSCLLVVLQ